MGTQTHTAAVDASELVQSIQFIHFTIHTHRERRHTHILVLLSHWPRCMRMVKGWGCGTVCLAGMRPFRLSTH